MIASITPEDRATIADPVPEAANTNAERLAFGATVDLSAVAPVLDVDADTLTSAGETPAWGEALGLGAFDQRELFERAMARVFEGATGGAPAMQIGRFTILRRLGEGGMGVVYAAYDAELDRKVAIKLVRDEAGNVESKARLLREAQAMARLAHPNVVAVYDVGLHGEQIYVAMEFIKGQTLTEWIDAHAGDWRAILNMFLKTGEGLAAAHAAGMVHRDFKPDNVLVSEDGRPRVLDFGLVRTDPGGSTPTTLDEEEKGRTGSQATLMESLRESDQDLDAKLTRAGVIMGTPAYMSPEQIRGRSHELDASSDQFSFCVVLYEALYGQLPFEGDNLRALFDAVTSGELRAPPRSTRVPSWIAHALRRGLSTDPARRWPSMRALLDTLARDPRRRYRVGAGLLGAATLLSSVSYGVASARASEAEICESARGELRDVWSDSRKQTVKRALMATGAAFAADAWERVEERVDRYAAGWSEMRHAGCESHREGLQSSELFDLSMRCLDRRRGDLEAAIELLEEADASVAENAVELVTSLRPLGPCADAEALRSKILPPSDPAVAAAAEAIGDQLGRAAVFKHAGKFREGVELARELRRRAESASYPPILARALLAEGDLEMELGEHEGAASDLHRAMLLALEVGDAEVAAEAIAKWFYISGAQLGRAEKVRGFEPMVLALARRQDEGSAIPALAYNNVGAVHYRQDDLEGAQEAFRVALELWESSEAANPLELAATLNNLGVTLRDRGQYERSAKYLARALAVIEGEVGAQHPNLAFPLFGLAYAQIELNDLASAELNFERSVTLLTLNQGEGAFPLVYPLAGLGQIHLREDEHEEAAAAFARSLEIWRASEIVDRDHGDTLCGYAEALRAVGRVEEATRSEAQAASLYAKMPRPDEPTRCEHAPAPAEPTTPAGAAR